MARLRCHVVTPTESALETEATYVEFPAWDVVQSERAGRRAALGIPPEAPVVLHVGSIHPSKDPGCLLRCIEEVHRHVPDAVVLRAGRPPLPGEASADAAALMSNPRAHPIGCAARS